jgi:hypothetical protein
MKARLAAAGAALVLFGRPAFAHRLDEYLQATTLSVAKDQVRAEIHLTPGVAVARAVLAGIDSDGDGVLSPAEVRAYTVRVLRDLSLSIDGERLPLRLASSEAAAVGDMRAGLGDIRIDVAADVPPGQGRRNLVFENHHRREIAAYLVNVLVPADPDIRVTAQDRTEDQSLYRLDYVEPGGGRGLTSVASWSRATAWLGAAALLLLARLALVGRSARVMPSVADHR